MTKAHIVKYKCKECKEICKYFNTRRKLCRTCYLKLGNYILDDPLIT